MKDAGKQKCRRNKKMKEGRKKGREQEPCKSKEECKEARNTWTEEKNEERKEN